MNNADRGWRAKLGPANPKPWKPFLLKAAGISSVTVVLSIAGVSAFTSRYEILIDPQVTKCLPDYTVYLVDRSDTTPVRGEPFAFAADGISEYLDVDDDRLETVRSYYADGKKLLKILDGLPGDRVEISESTLKVNGISTGVPGLVLSKTLQKPSSFYERSEEIPSNKFFFAGRTFDSFDSRYWGNVDRGQIIGRAYPLF